MTKHFTNHIGNMDFLLRRKNHHLLGEGCFPLWMTKPVDSKRILSGFEESESVEVEAVDEIPPPNFNPSLTGPFELVLLVLRGNFGESFSFFSDLHMISRVSVSSSM